MLVDLEWTRHSNVTTPPHYAHLDYKPGSEAGGDYVLSAFSHHTEFI